MENKKEKTIEVIRKMLSDLREYISNFKKTTSNNNNS